MASEPRLNQTLAEGLDVWNTIIGMGYRPMTLKEIQQLTDHGEQKLRRILATLQAKGLLSRRAEGYVPSTALITKVAALASDVAARLAAARELNELVQLAKARAAGRI